MSRKYRGQGAVDRLEQLGLEPSVLRDAAMSGERARRGCTENDPQTCAGYLGWAKSVRALREQLLPLGWSRSEVNGLSTIVAPDRSFAIGVATGDEATGDPDREPKTKNPRGPATDAAVGANQFLLFEPFHQAPEEEMPLTTWCLLWACVGDELRLELSVPLRLGDDNRIEEWDERILLESTSLETDVPAQLELSATIDVDVIPRVTRSE